MFQSLVKVLNNLHCGICTCKKIMTINLVRTHTKSNISHILYYVSGDSLIKRSGVIVFTD